LSAWQKGLAKKVNSMIHRILPKDKDINTLTIKKLEKVEKYSIIKPLIKLGMK